MAEADKFEMMEVLTKKQEEERKRKLKAKKRNYIIGFSCLGAGVITLSVIYTLSATIWLKDIASLPYVTYTYSANPNGEKVATITKFNPQIVDKNGMKYEEYPSKFIIPETVNGLKVTGIANSAFANFTKLETIVMPNTIEYIGDYAFYGCTNLANIKFSDNITHLGAEAFEETAYLKNLDEDNVHVISDILYKVGYNVIQPNTVLVENKDSVIPDKFKGSDFNYVYFDEWNDEISQWSNGLFTGNKNIVYVEIPSYIESVPNDTFKNATNLKGVSLTSSTKRIGKSAFANCNNLSDIAINESVVSIGEEALMGTAIVDINLPETMEHIGNGAFKNCLSIEEFSWPSNLNIPDYAFYGCENLTSFVFDEGGYENINYIGKSAFKNTSLTEFTFPMNVTVVSESVLENVDELETVYMYEGRLEYDHFDNEVFYGIGTIQPKAFKTKDGKTSNLKSIVLIDENQNKLTPYNKVTLPKTLQVVSTSSSSGSIFANTAITEFTFPANVLKTSPSMFENALNLKKVNFETRHIGTSFTGIQYISFKTFANTGLEEIVIPDSVTTIEANAFENSKLLKKVTLPGDDSNLTTIPSALFLGCESLESVNINKNIYTIKTQSFTKTYNLEYVYIPHDNPNKLTIEKFAFQDVRKEGEGKMPIYLNVSKDEVNSIRMPEPVIEVDDKGNEVLVSAGWYDTTCQVYWKGMWEFVDGVPTPKKG